MILQAKLSGKKIDFNPEFRKAISIVESSHENLFITGKAGTGKSTLLSHWKGTTSKRIAVLAPTGVAALNVGGQTIHSFCRFKPDITPENVKKLEDVSHATRNMYLSLDTIVIDEISMVRADLLDCLDRFMRLNGGNPAEPFGGVQMVFIGDLYQLPPVVTSDEQEIFREHYKSPYFFESKAFNELEMNFIELKRFYRQSDMEFIRLLNAIRDNTATAADLEKLNSRLDPDFNEVFAPDSYITLTATNASADNNNNGRLKRLPTAIHRYRATITGNFNKKAYPADEILEVKEGAQVMMLTNDSEKRWVNGSLGNVVSFESDPEGREGIVVQLSDGERVSVHPHTWETSKLSYDSANKKLVSMKMGSFTQYPMMLAWAVTIHKSQGKTFDHVVIDVGDGTFAHGQLYVALSRCTSLHGIVLRRKLQMKHIITDGRIAEFHKEHFG